MTASFGLRDIFERPFDGEDDPRIRVAQAITRAEAEAILEHRGDLILALSAPSPVVEGQGTVDKRIAAAQVAVGLGVADIGPIIFDGRRGVLISPRDQHIPLGEPGRIAGEYWPKPHDVVIWIDGPPDVLIGEIQSVATDAPTSPPQAPWRCAKCGCTSCARVDERKPDGHFAPGAQVRCVECKDVSTSPPQATNSEVERLREALGRLTKACRVDDPGELLDALNEADAALDQGMGE